MSDPVASEIGVSSGTAPPLEASGSPQFDGSGVVVPEGSSRAGRVSSDPVVFGVTAAMAAAILARGLVWPTSFKAVMSSILSAVVTNLGWLFVFSATGFVLFALWLALGRFSRIPLGADGEKPEFRTVSWVAMMFSADMGIGLIFFGVTVPLTHFVKPPPGIDGSSAGMALLVVHSTDRPPRGRADR